MKTINMTFNEEDFERLKKVKEKKVKISKARISWEKFVFNTICGK